MVSDNPDDPGTTYPFSVVDVLGAQGVTIRNMTMTGGQADAGSGVHNTGQLVLVSVVVRDNVAYDTAPRGGGGIYNEGTLTVLNSTISGNTSRVAGGGIFNFGTLTVDASTVRGNQAPYGGGIHTDSFLGAGNVTIRSSKITGNTADAGGAALSVIGTSTVTVAASAVTGNTVLYPKYTLNSPGGAIFTFDAPLTLSATSVRNNVGGGVVTYGGPVKLFASVVRGNTPFNCMGVSGC